eukprot:m.524942 g.524942  ORF g.524942 m.524942 type:complete len:500 (-) comp21996_c0_seq3:5468-6967(-)
METPSNTNPEAATDNGTASSRPSRRTAKQVARYEAISATIDNKRKYEDKFDFFESRDINAPVSSAVGMSDTKPMVSASRKPGAQPLRGETKPASSTGGGGAVASHRSLPPHKAPIRRILKKSSTTHFAAVASGATPGAAPVATWEWVGDRIPDPRIKSVPLDQQRYIYYEKVRCLHPEYDEFTLTLGDGVHLKAADDEATLAYVARLRGLCEDRKAESSNDNKFVIIEWFFRPEELRQGRIPSRHHQNELFVKKSGRNVVRVYSLNCVESPCTVLEFPEYCRYRANQKRKELLGKPEPENFNVYFVREWHDNEDIYRSRKKGHQRPRDTGNSEDRKRVRLADVSTENVNKRNSKGETKLHIACAKGNLDEVRTLIRLGATTDVTCNAGWTPLHEACAYDHVDVVSVLLRHTVDVNALGPNGTMPLHDAAENQNAEMVSLLMRHGATPAVPDANGKLPIDLCNGNEAIMAQLRKKRESRRAAAIACDNVNMLITNLQYYK